MNSYERRACLAQPAWPEGQEPGNDMTPIFCPRLHNSALAREIFAHPRGGRGNGGVAQSQPTHITEEGSLLHTAVPRQNALDFLDHPEAMEAVCADCTDRRLRTAGVQDSECGSGGSIQTDLGMWAWSNALT